MNFVYKNQERVSALKGVILGWNLMPTEQFLKAHRLLKCTLKLVRLGKFRSKFLYVNSLNCSVYVLLDLHELSRKVPTNL